MAPAAAALVVLLASSARASDLDWLTQYKQPNFHYGQVALHPSYQLTEMYDSNIYLVPRDNPSNAPVGGVRGSWITKNKLALESALPWHRLHDLAAGYAFESHQYTTDAHVNDTINQSAHMDYDYLGAYGLAFRAGDRYLNTTDQAFSQLIRRERRWENVVYAGLDYDPEHGRVAGGVDASHTVVKYLGSMTARQLNRYSQRAGFNAGYKIRPKTKLYAVYHRGITHYTVHRAAGDQDRNSKYHELGLGATGVLAPKITGQFEAGVVYREYDEPPINGVTRVTNNLTVASNMVYRPQDRTAVILALSRSLQESISDSTRFYIANNVSLDVKHRLPRRFSAGVNLAFSLDKYPDAQIAANGAPGSRRDDIYQGGAWVEYDIQAWLSTGVSYVFRERDSTFSGEFNYQDQQVAWNLALKF